MNKLPYRDMLNANVNTALIICLGAWYAAAPAQAQIVASPGAAAQLRPTVLVAPNGVPLVDIQSPSAAGVSRNVYSQFDVQRNGAILNNARTASPTHLGAWTSANPWLAGGAARIIVNEVDSARPTQLRGPIEIAGQRAELVIANPAGIEVDGGGFINASRATLTTGTPRFDAVGGLDSFVVRGGAVRIDGAGLDASQSDYAAILARAVQVNAGLWARELKVLAGASQISGDHLQSTPVAGQANAPAFALDVAQLGGMYARKIVLVGNEAGLGVRNAGHIGASAGELVVTSAGRLENRGTLEAPSVQVSSTSDIDNRQGVIWQTGAASLALDADRLSNTRAGRIGAQPPPEVAWPDGGATSGTTPPAGGSSPGAPPAGAGPRDANGGDAGQTQPYAPAPGHIRAAGAILNDAGHIQAGGPIALHAAQIDNASGFLAVADLSVNGGAFGNAGGSVDVAHALSANVAAFDNTRGTVRAGELHVAATGELLNHGGSLESRGNAGLRIDAGTVRNVGGLIRSGGTTTVHAGDIDNTATGAAGQGIEGQNVALAFTRLDNTAGALRAERELSLIGTASVINHGGLISSRDTLRVAATPGATPGAKTLGIANSQGTLVAERHLAIDAASLSFDGQIVSQGSAELALSRDMTVLAGSQTTAAGDLRIATAGDIVNHGALLAGGSLELAATRIDNTATGELGGGHTRIDAAALVNRGLIDSQGHTRIDAATLDNLGTARIYGDRISIAAGSLNNEPETTRGVTRAATIAARDTLDIGATRIRNREHALLFSAGDLFIGGALDTHRYALGQGATLDNASASIEALGRMHIAMRTLNNTDAHMQVARSSSGPVADRRTITPLGGIELPYDQFVLDHASRTWATLVDGQFLTGQGWLDRQYQVTTDTDHALNPPDPGRIVAGGDLRIDGLLHNRDSHVIAGGRIDIAPAHVDNAPTQGQQIVTTDGLSFLVTPLPGQPGVPGLIPATREVRTIDLGVNRFEPGVAGTTGNAPGPARDVSPDARAATVGALVEVPSNQGAFAQVARTRAPDASLLAALLATSLFNLRDDAASPTLVETDPRFAGYRPWLDSSDLLRQLGIDPHHLPKRLGDGFYEQKLIREQIAQLTGHRYLEGHDSDEAQLAALMNAGATFARQFQLTPGVALSAAQMAQLTSDIVWLVERRVTLADGTTRQVLVPQVYVRVRPGDIDGSGALLAADRLVIQPDDRARGAGAPGDLVNRGTIAGRTLVNIRADNVHNLGGRISGASVDIDARDDLNNLGGTLDARHALELRAGRDIDVRTTTQTQAGPLARRTNIDRVAGLYVTDPGGTLAASAGRDVKLIAAVVRNQGATSADPSTGTAAATTVIRAGRDIQLGTVVQNQARLNLLDPVNYRGEASSHEVGTTLATQGTTLLHAGRDIDARQARVDSGAGVLGIQAGRDIRIASGQRTEQILSGNQSTNKGTFKRSTQSQATRFDSSTAQASRLDGGLIAIGAGNDLDIEGARIQGEQGVLLSAGRRLSIREARDTLDAHAEVARRRSDTIVDPFVGKNSQHATALDIHADTAAPSTLASPAGGITLQGRSVDLQGVKVDAAQDLRIRGDDVRIAGAVNHARIQTEDRTRGGRFSPSGWHDPGQGLGARNTDTIDAQVDTLTRSELGAANIHIAADPRHGQLRLAGTTVRTPGTLSLDAGTLHLDTQSTGSALDIASQGKDFAWQHAASRGNQHDTLHYNQIDAGQLAIHAPRIQAGLGARDSIEALAAQPGMGWVQQLERDPALQRGVDWVQVEQAHRHWNYAQQGLTPEGAAVVTVVTAFFTAGAASGIGTAAGEGAAVAAGEGVALSGGGAFVSAGTGAAISSVVGGAVSAGVTALAGQAAVAALNSRGNLGHALEELGASASVKNLASAILTGGALAGLNLNPSGLPTVQGGAQPFMTQLGQNLSAGAARAVIQSAIQGGSLEGHLREGLRTALIDTAAAQGAFAIGEQELNRFVGAAAHAIAGCAAGAARADSASGCAAGALGAAIGELSAEAYGRRSDTVPFAAMMSAIAVAVSGGDAAQINLGSQAGANAAANNYLAHNPANTRQSQLRGFAEQLSRCQATEGCNVKDVYAYWSDISTAQQGAAKEAAATWALTGDASRLGQLLADTAGALGANPADFCSPGDGQCAQFIQSQNNQAFSVYRDTATFLASLDYVGGGLNQARASTASWGSDRMVSARRVENNFYRDGAIADPGVAMSSSGNWRPAATLTAAEADRMVANSLPTGVKAIGMKGAESANVSAIASGWEPPYIPGTVILETVATQPQTFVRVYAEQQGRINQVGTWIMRPEDVAGLTPVQIASKFGLPQVPTMMTDVIIPVGTSIDVSAANGVSPFANQGIFTGGNGGGGGVQFQLALPPRELDPAWFLNARPLK